MKYLIPLIFIFISTLGYGQEKPSKVIYDFSEEKEYFHEHKHEKESTICLTKIANHKEHQLLEEKISNPKIFPKSNEIYTVPVVVHIIHDGDAYGTGSNIDDEQVWSAIQGMNEDFRKYPGTLGDGDGADVGVEFCLATIDPDGNPTTGINRVNGCSVTDYCSEGITAGQGQGANELDVKNLSRWPNQEYYNIWVVTEIENNNGGSGIQGYAYFPTTSPVDGTVILYNAFGTEGNLKSYTNKNRTLTHELGHGFALFHTFQGGSCNETNCALQGDRVCDTPPTVLNSSCSFPACGGTQQVENYMDYTSQSCKDMFTEGQKERMRLSIVNSRSNLINSNKCGVYEQTTGMEISIISPEVSTCEGVGDIELEIENIGTEIIYNTDVEVILSEQTLMFDWIGPIGPGQTAILKFDSVQFTSSDTEIIVNVLNINDYPISDFSISQDLFITGETVGYVELMLDVLGGQTTWEIKNVGTGEVIKSEGTFPNFQSGTVYTYDLCLLPGCYEITVFDAVNNGICCLNGNGYFKIFDNEDNLVFEATDFGSEATYTICVDDNPLPVEFLEISAECLNDNGVKIEWSTASELNNDFFTLYRSSTLQGNGGFQVHMPFTEIAVIEGNGTTSTQSDYSYTDYVPSTSIINYYKLKQTDFNGEQNDFNGESEISVTCKRPIVTCPYEFVLGSFYPRNSKVFSSSGFPIKNRNIQDGIYILKLEKCVYRVAINQGKIIGQKKMGR